MKLDTSSYDRIVSFASQQYGVEIKFKDESRFMKALGYLLFFNPKFMTRFVTVIGKTVYFPSRQRVEQDPDSAARVLCHELVHLTDARRVGALSFSLSYLFPQCLALLALSAIFVGPWALLFLAFLAPLPAPLRTFWELRGYAMTDAVAYRMDGKFTFKDWMAGQFTSGSYFFMWPFLSDIKDRIEENRKLILNGTLHEKIPAATDILNAYFGAVDE